MKTTIYSQKHHYEHHNTIPLTPNPYSNSSSNMSKKSSTMKKFQYCINANTIQNVKTPKQSHYHYLNQISSNSNNSTTIMKPKKPTQKPVYNVQKNIINFFVKQYQKIISNITNYYKYYEWILIKQIQKHDSYFNDLIKVIQHEKRKSQNYLQQQLKTLSQKIQLQKGALQNKISQLQNNNLKSYDKQKSQLQSQRYLQLPLFQVQLKKVDKYFKSQIMKKFIFQVKTAQQLQRQQQATTTFQQQQQRQHRHQRQSSIFTTTQTIEQLQQSLTKTEKKSTTTTTMTRQQQMDLLNVSCLEIDQLMPNYAKDHNYANEEDQVPIISIKKSATNNNAVITSLQDDKDLYCDEDIENILKQNKGLKKKKYDFKQDAIPQQSESHQDSLNISNINSIC